MGQGLPFSQKVFDHCLPFMTLGNGYFCKAITRQINQPPFGYNLLFINRFNREMIDELCFPGSR
jgi:hypothetical protein